jgi:peptidoglycan/xylan/chitin deacetylase (PgdA/CDA1 family)
MFSRRVAVLMLVLLGAGALAGCAQRTPTADWHAPAPAVPPADHRGTVVALNAAPTSVTGVVEHTGTAAMALTFDDGPGPDTPRILALLRAQGVKATFCLIGVNVRANPGLVQQIVADGHSLCNHSWRHDLKLGSKSADAIRQDLQATTDEIHRAVPDAPIRYFRQPGGEWTANEVKVVRDMGLTPLGWSVDPFDWDAQKYGTGAGMTNHIVTTIQHGAAPGAIVLSHDGGGDRSCTLAAYRTLLPWLKSRYELIAMP